jgi:putative FmdB family regulatory protein
VRARPWHRGAYNQSVPTYENACLSCGHHIEVYQRFSDEPLSECGVCGGPLRKVFHPAGILFKGSGFYSTDSRRSVSKKSAESTAAASGSEPGSGGAGASSPPEKPAKAKDPSPSSAKERSA